MNASARSLLEEEEVVEERKGGGQRRRRNEERTDGGGGGGHNCTIFPEACQLLSGFTNLVDRTEFEGHCSNSDFHGEIAYRETEGGPPIVNHRPPKSRRPGDTFVREGAARKKVFARFTKEENCRPNVSSL